MRYSLGIIMMFTTILSCTYRGSDFVIGDFVKPRLDSLFTVINNGIVLTDDEIKIEIIENRKAFFSKILQKHQLTNRNLLLIEYYNKSYENYRATLFLTSFKNYSYYTYMKDKEGEKIKFVEHGTDAYLNPIVSHYSNFLTPNENWQLISDTVEGPFFHVYAVSKIGLYYDQNLFFVLKNPLYHKTEVSLTDGVTEMDLKLYQEFVSNLDILES